MSERAARFEAGTRIKLLTDVSCSVYNPLGRGFEITGPRLPAGERGTLVTIINFDEGYVNFDKSDTVEGWDRVWVHFGEVRTLSILEQLAEITSENS